MLTFIAYLFYAVLYFCGGLVVAVLTKKIFLFSDKRKGEIYNWEYDYQMRDIPICLAGLLWPFFVIIFPLGIILYFVINYGFDYVEKAFDWLDKLINPQENES